MGCCMKKKNLVEGIRVVNNTELSKYTIEANKDIPPGCLLKIGHFE